MNLPVPSDEFEELVEPYDSATESGSVHLSTVVSSDIGRLIEIIMQQDFGYTSKSDLVRDFLIKWIIVMTEAIKNPDYQEYITHVTRMRATHAAQIRRTRQVKGADFVAAAEDELQILISSGEWIEAARTAVKQIESIQAIGGTTARVWLKSYLSDVKIASHLASISDKRFTEATILKGLINDCKSPRGSKKS